MVASGISSGSPPAPTGWRRRWLMAFLGAVAAICLAVFVVAARQESPVAGLPLDDSYIHLQFARSLAQGDGLAFRAGDRVSGSTAPLWTAVLAVLFALPGPLLLWVEVAGAALYLCGAALTWTLARELGLGSPAAAGSALLFLLTDAMVWSALSGMEVCLFVVLSLGGVVLHLRERRSGGAPSLSLAVLGLACLARPEGLLLLVLAILDRVALPAPSASARGRWLGLAVGAACALILVGGFQLFSLAVSDSLLPTTYAVKTDGPRALLPSGLYLLRVVGVLFRTHPVPVLLATAGALGLLERLGTSRDRGLLPALWLLGLPLAYSLYDAPGAPMMVGNFGRYCFPLFPFVLVLAAVALERPLATLATAPPPLRTAVAVALAAALLVPPLTSLGSGSRRYGANVRDVNASDVAMARWIREHVPPQAVIAAQDVGAVGFFTPNPLIDLTGIVTPEILPWIEGDRGAGGREGLVRYLAERRPDYLMLFADSYPWLLESLDLEVVERRRLAANVTMAGSDLVLLRPRWEAAAPATPAP